MLVNNLRLNRAQKQEKSKKTKQRSSCKEFSISKNVDTSQESHATATSYNISQTNPFLALQEFDVVLENHSRLQQHGKTILRKLHNIRLALLNNEIYIDEIIAIKGYLSTANVNFELPECTDLINEILVRAEVEITKYEMLKKENGGR